MATSTDLRSGFIRRRLALCAAAVSLAALAAAGLLALAGGGEGTFLIPYEVYEAGGMPKVLSFAAAEEEAERQVGGDLKMVGTAGGWAEVVGWSPKVGVPTWAFEGGEPPPEILLDMEFNLSFGGWVTVSEYVEGLPFVLWDVTDGWAIYAPDFWAVPVFWGSEGSPDPELSAALAAEFEFSGGVGGTVWVMPEVQLHGRGLPIEPLEEHFIESWRAGGKFLYEPVAPPNQPPTAKASAGETVVVVGQPIQFRGDESSDPDGDALDYLWDFDDGETSTEANPVHSYGAPGTYAVELTVHDPESESDTATVDIIVVGVTFSSDPVVMGVSKTETLTATITPAEGFPFVSFSTADNTVAAVDPLDAASPSQELTVSGLQKGVTTLKAQVNYQECGSAVVRVGRVDFVRITPDPGYLTPGERTTFTAIGFATVQGYPALPRGYAPDLGTPLGAEVRFVTPQGADTRGIYLGPVKGRWKLEGGPNAEAFIPLGVPSENVSTVEVEAAPHAAGDISPDLFFYLANGDGETVKLGAPGVQFLKFGTGQVITKVVAGYSVPANKSTLAKKVTVSVNPAKDAVNVKFTVTGQNRVQFNVIKKAKDLAKGLLTVEIFGRSATPANKPNGDTVLQAKLGAKTWPLNVVVEVPTDQTRRIHAPKTKNSHKDNPAGGGRPATTTLKTQVGVLVEIQVLNQFGSPLNEVYSGRRVVREFFSDKKGAFFQGFPAQGWITNPDDVLDKNGIKKDLVTYETEVTGGKLGAAKTRNWDAGKLKVNGFSNALGMQAAISGTPVPLNGTYAGNVRHKIEVHGHAVRGSYRRKIAVDFVPGYPVPCRGTDTREGD